MTMRQHSALRDYFPLVHLWDLLKEFDELTNKYKNDPHHSQLIEDLRNLTSKYSAGPSQKDTRSVYTETFIEEMNDRMHHYQRYGLLEALMRLKKPYFEDCPQRRTIALDTLLELFKEIDDLMNQYESGQNNAEDIFKKLKDKMSSHSWKDYIFNKKVTDLLQEMNKVMEQHELKQNHIATKEYTPHDVFVKEHAELMAEGEKWMRDTANSCIIVAVLITTITFAAVITVPGGNADDGYPIFSSEILFKAFAIADSISMISSAISLLNFLSILTARYTIDDFRWSLPNKLFVGLLTIFISIVAMMLAFVLSIFIVFKNISPLFSILIAATSALPIALFMWQHSGFFLDVFGSTYASYFLFKTRNDPSLVFRRTSSFGVEHKKNV